MEENSLNFKNLNIPIHEDVNSYTMDKQKEIYNYLCQLDEQQKKAYVIAFNHLGSSFNIYKSNGFKSWKVSQGK